MKVLVVAGARPNFMKVAPILNAIAARGWQAILVHTGQHFDSAMSDSFFADLAIREPDHHLGVGAGSHAEQTARVMERFDAVLIAERPDWVVVVGDVNSTVAAALVTAKRRPEIGCRLAHVEAGLRSGDWRMPEEVNRVVTDQLADLLLTHSPEAASHLAAEGVPAERIEFVGNVMIDSLFATLKRTAGDAPWSEHGLTRGGYGLVTLHRPSNVDSPERLQVLLDGLGAIATSLPLLWPVHPRARRMLEQLSVPSGLQLTEPASYREMVHLLDGCDVVITDSGGLQEESTALGIPCVTLREATERPVTVTEGTNRLVPWPPTAAGIVETVAAARAVRGKAVRQVAGWDGRAAERVVDALERAPKSAARCVLPASP
jgi:UDP-N-acetylglucosamine 2-epimerase (non-hydrolysing)